MQLASLPTLYMLTSRRWQTRKTVFTKHAVDPLLNKARPIRFNKKDSATSEEPEERDLRDLMKFVEDDTLKGLCKHLFLSIATYIMTLETLFSHPAEYAKCHRESPEVQAFKQSPPKPSVTLRQLRKTNKLAAYGTR